MSEERKVILVDLDAWAAGLFEGEGTVMVSMPWGRMVNPQLQLSLSSTDFDVLDRFADWAGRGTVCFLEPRKSHHKRQKRWGARDALDVVLVIERLLPFMGERRGSKMIEVLEAAANFQVAHNWKEKQERVREEARRILSERGWFYDYAA